MRRLPLLAIASLTRNLPGYRGASLLKRLHRPTTLSGGIETEVPLELGLRMRVNSASLFEWPVFFYGARKWEPAIRALLHQYIRPGHTAIDVGANDGIHTLVMARLVATGRVLACEPNPLPCARLRQNLDLNRLTNVEVQEVAAGAVDGTATLFVPVSDTSQAWASLRRNIETRTSQAWARQDIETRTLEVRVATLDTLVDEGVLRDVDLIKIDVEGSEPEVLAGASRVLSRDHPALIFEYADNWWSRPLDNVLEDLRSAGYRRFHRISEQGLAPLSGSRMDILALPEHKGPPDSELV